MLAAVLCVGISARADTYQASYTYNNNEQVTITYTGAPVGGVKTSAISFSVTDKTTGSPAFTAYCVDLWHSTKSGDTFTASPVTSGFASVVSSEASPNSISNAGDPALSNELNYLGYVYSKINASDAAVVGAIQLAIWHVIDNNFQVTTWAPDANLKTDYNNVVGLLGGTNWGSIAAYNSSTSYANGLILQVSNQTSSSDQNLIAWTTSGAPQVVTGAPEPSSIAIALAGAVAFLGYGLRRRFWRGANLP